MIRPFHLQNPPIPSDNYETNEPDPCCLSGNGHGRPGTQRERVQTCTSRLVQREGRGGGCRGGRGIGVVGCLGLWEIPRSPRRGESAHRSQFRDSLAVRLSGFSCASVTKTTSFQLLHTHHSLESQNCSIYKCTKFQTAAGRAD